MSTWTCHHCLALRWTRQLRFAQQVRRHTSTTKVTLRDGGQKDGGVTASQLLRFATTGNIRAENSLEQVPNDKIREDYLRRTFRQRNIPFSVFKHPRRGAENFRNEALNISTLEELKVFVVRNVTDRDSAAWFAETTFDLERLIQTSAQRGRYADLLATLTAIVARCEEWRTQNYDILTTGMRTAIRAFSVAAMRSYIDVFAAQNYHLSHRVAELLLEDLTAVIELRRWENSAIDMDSMLELVIGVDGDSPQKPSLYSLIDWSPRVKNSRVMSLYVRLLGLMGDKKRLPEMWAIIEDALSSEQGPALRRAVTSCLRALLDSGNSAAALKGVKGMAKYVDVNREIPLELWRDLLESDSSGKLREIANKERAESFINAELSSIEARLGISWTSVEGDGYHSRAEDVPIWSYGDPDGIDLSIPPASNGVSGPANTRQLIEEITVRGCSPKSRSNLSVIADLLDENEGLEVPLGIRSDEQPGLWHSLAWFPMRSPIEFSDNPISLRYNASKPPSSASLGLLRARSCHRGAPLKHGPTFHLMQLGYIAARKDSSELASEWESTGHILAWERVSRTFHILFVGKGYGNIDPGPTRLESDNCLPHFHAIVKMEPFSRGSRSGHGEFVPIGSDEYWIDVDPTPSLRP